MIYAATQEPMLAALCRTITADLYHEKHAASATVAEDFLLQVDRDTQRIIQILKQQHPESIKKRRIPMLKGFSYRDWAFRIDHETDILGAKYPDYVASAMQRFDLASDNPKHPNMILRDLEGIMEGVQAGRKLFITKRGYLGIGPEWIEPGDNVILVAGAYVPFIFRRVNDPTQDHISGDDSREELNQRAERLPGAGSYLRLIGEAYVHGIMHGEALQNQGVKFKTVVVV